MSWESLRSKISGRDLVLFTLSLLLAFAIWLIHNLSFNYKEQVGVPVLANCTLEGRAYSSSNSAMVYARCKASGFSLISLLKSQEKAPVAVKFESSDLHYKVGDIYYISGQELEPYSAKIFGEGTQVEAYMSDTLFFKFTRQDSRRVPVTGKFKLSYIPQYMAGGQPEFVPDSVTVFGEPSQIKAIESVSTALIEKSGISGPLHGNIRLEEIPGVRLSDETVEYSLDVSRYVELRADVTLSVENVPHGRMMVVYPSVATIVMRCKFPLPYSEIVEPDVYIDYQDFKNSISGRCLPKADNLPAGTIEYSFEPQVFECVEIVL